MTAELGQCQACNAVYKLFNWKEILQQFWTEKDSSPRRMVPYISQSHSTSNERFLVVVAAKQKIK